MDGIDDEKSKPANVWHTALEENPYFVAPKIWCELHLLQILAEGRETSFLSSRGGEISLASVSLVLTGSFWIPETLRVSEEGHPYPGPFHYLNLNHYHSGDFGNIRRVKSLKNSRSTNKEEWSPPHVSYIGDKPGGNQFAQISKKELQAR